MLLDLYKVVIANTIEGIHLPSGSSVDVRSDKQLSCPIVLWKVSDTLQGREMGFTLPDVCGCLCGCIAWLCTAVTQQL